MNKKTKKLFIEVSEELARLDGRICQLEKEKSEQVFKKLNSASDAILKENSTETEIKKPELTELPEKWCVKVTENNFEIINNFLQENIKEYYFSNSQKPLVSSKTIDAYFEYPQWEKTSHSGYKIQKGYTEISTEDFKRLVLKEEVKEDLEFGKWYKGNESLLFAEGKPQYDLGYKTIRGYGIIEGDWVGKDSEPDFYNGWSEDSNLWSPATNEEVEAALINEAKKRGFKDAYFFKSLKVGYDKQGYGRKIIYQNGTWAEIIEDPKEYIDWSKPGQLVVNDNGSVYEILVDNYDETFGGVCRLLKGEKHFAYNLKISKQNLKQYTGEPITLKN